MRLVAGMVTAVAFAVGFLATGPAAGQTLMPDTPDESPASAAPAAAPKTPAAPVVLYTKDNAPPTPKLSDLPLKESVSRDGVT